MKILKANEYIREKSLAWYCKKYWKPATAALLAVGIVTATTAFTAEETERQGNVQEPIKTCSQSEYEPIPVLADVPLDADLQWHIFEVAEQYGLEPELVLAVIGQESNYQSQKIGDDGESKGLMQVQASQHADRMERLGCTDLLDPYENVLVGIDYLAECMNNYDKVSSALTVYNAGATGAYVHYFSKGIDGNDYANEVMERWEDLIQ